ncbi:MAG: putative toxin-antitoxin system toxin component, PIN family [Candidatus Woesearchaeota archaeon]
MGTPTIIIDTNVLVSALGWKGAPREILERVLSGEYTLVTCSEQLDELTRVLSYPKLAITPDERERFLAIISNAATVVEVKTKLAPLEDDPSDTMLLELAVAARAAYLISGDGHLTQLKRFEHTRIMSPRAFLEIRRYDRP